MLEAMLLMHLFTYGLFILFVSMAGTIVVLQRTYAYLKELLRLLVLYIRYRHEIPEYVQRC